MPRRNQARIRIHKKRLDLGLSVTQLAARVDHDTAVVSKAINHGLYPRVLAKVKGVLGV